MWAEFFYQAKPSLNDLLSLDIQAVMHFERELLHNSIIAK